MSSFTVNICVCEQVRGEKVKGQTVHRAKSVIDRSPRLVSGSWPSRRCRRTGGMRQTQGSGWREQNDVTKQLIRAD